MSNPLYAFPTVCEQTLRALARYPSRTAFSWPGGSLSYQGATDLIGRIQKRVHAARPAARHPGRAAVTANRADTWCSGVAAQLSRLSITSLHPLGSLDDQLFQLEDSEAQMLVVDAATFRDRGGDLAAKAASAEDRVHARPGRVTASICCRRSRRPAPRPRAALPAPTIIATLNYTGGTTGKSKGALRHHREFGGFATAILADFEIPDTPRYLTVAPISHVAGTKVLPTLMRGGTVHHAEGL